MDELYTVMHGGENCYRHIMSDNENGIADALNTKLKDALSSEWALEGLKIKYSNKIGYYAIEDNDRGHYSMRSGFPTKDELEAFTILLDYGSRWEGFEYERKNRAQLQKDWSKSFKSKYDGRKFAFEYSLQKLCSVLGYIPDKYINYYESLLKIMGTLWEFDTAKKCFVEKI